MVLTPYTTEVSLEISFLSYTYRVRFPVTVLPLHVHSSLCWNTSIHKQQQKQQKTKIKSKSKTKQKQNKNIPTVPSSAFSSRVSLRFIGPWVIRYCFDPDPRKLTSRLLTVCSHPRAHRDVESEALHNIKKQWTYIWKSYSIKNTDLLLVMSHNDILYANHLGCSKFTSKN